MDTYVSIDGRPVLIVQVPVARRTTADGGKPAIVIGPPPQQANADISYAYTVYQPCEGD